MSTEPKTDTPEQKALAAHLMPLIKILEAHSKPKMSSDAKALVLALLTDMKTTAEATS
jgi:hypothetical protein